MTTNKYITLQDSTGSGARFGVVQGYFKRTKKRNQDVRDTLGGGVDVSQGGIVEIHQYVIRCRDDEPRENYGDYTELERLWMLNNPNGTPSDKITFIDHYGDSHTVIFLDTFDPNALTTIIEGEGAWFFVPVVFRFLPVEEPEPS